MRRRCFDPGATGFEDYGGRGITVCDAWKSFEVFLEDMGTRPEGTTLERKNNGLGYNKGNCKWATLSEQNRNRRNNRVVSVGGQPMSLAAAVERHSAVTYSNVQNRLSLGWSEVDAISTPLMSKAMSVGLAVSARLENQKIMFDGHKYTWAELASKHGMTKSTLWQRVKVQGMSLNQAIDLGPTREVLPISEEDIVSLMKDYHSEFGRWPSSVSGKYRGEHFGNLDHALTKGLRGLPKGGSISKLKVKYNLK